MHIAFVTPESPYGADPACGVAAYLRAIIPAIVDLGNQVTVFANAKEERDFFAVDGRVPVHHFRLPSLHWYASKMPGVRHVAPLPLRQLEWSREFYRRVARVASQQIDIIESTEAGSLFLDRIAPLVIRLHGSEMTFRKNSGARVDLSVKWNDTLESHACRGAAAITSPSRSQAEEICARRGWDQERVQVIPNPISANILKAAQEFHRNGNNERIVLYTGRLARVKGTETLINAARLVHEKDPSVRFVLAGPWQMPQLPETYGLKLNQTSEYGVQWVGPQEQAELIEWYKRAAVFVMPSYFESFGISVAEAMAFGLPIVCTRTGPLPEIVDDGVTGFVVPPGETSQIASAILRAFSDALRNQSLGLVNSQKLQSLEPRAVALQNMVVYEQAAQSAALS